MGTALIERYNTEWSDLLSRPYVGPPSEGPTNPLLLNAPEAYRHAGTRVMIFGQETNDWYGSFPYEGGVRDLLERYDDFYCSGGCYAYSGHFWNGFHKILCTLDPGDGKFALWNNIVKVGKAGSKGRPSPSLLEWQKRWLEVVRFEVEHLAPNVVIFLTGPNYDGEIVGAFPGARFEAAGRRPERQLARVVADGLPMRSVRTYHPNYLYRHDFDQYLGDLLAALQV